MKLNPLARLTTAVAAVALVLSASGCAGSANESSGAPVDGTPTATLNLGALIDIKSWDPSQADIGHLIPYYQAVYDNLVLRSPEGEITPNLATDWSWNDSNTVLTMNLRTDVTFTDGAAFDASAAKANLDNFINGNGPYASTMAGVTVAAVDSDTIELTLAEANPDFLYYLATTGSFMASPNALGTEGLATAPVGSGPYVLSSASLPGTSIIVEMNENYWDKSKQKFKTINFNIIADVTARLNAIVSGQIDATVLDIPTSEAALGQGLTLQENYVDWQGLLIFDHNGQKGSPLADVRVRQAIAQAIDRDAMLQQLQKGYGEVTNQVYGKAASAYVSDLDSYYPYDPAKAKALVEEAGQVGAKITMPAWPDPSLNAILGDYLAEVGLVADFVQVPLPEYRNELKAGNYPAGIFQLFQGTSWVNTRLVATQDGSWNVLQSTDPVIEAAVSSIKADGSDENVATQTQAINRFLVENAWYIPFYRIPQMFFVNDKVTVVNQIQNAVPYIYNYSPAE